MKLVTLILFCALFVGCTSAKRAQFSSYGKSHSIELYSGGEMVRSWTSVGKVASETDSDGYYFMDEATGVLVRVTGDLVVTPKIN